jgi:hypothetical protein
MRVITDSRVIAAMIRSEPRRQNGQVRCSEPPTQSARAVIVQHGLEPGKQSADHLDIEPGVVEGLPAAKELDPGDNDGEQFDQCWRGHLAFLPGINSNRSSTAMSLCL